MNIKDVPLEPHPRFDEGDRWWGKVNFPNGRAASVIYEPKSSKPWEIAVLDSEGKIDASTTIDSFTGVLHQLEESEATRILEKIEALLVRVNQ